MNVGQAGCRSGTAEPKNILALLLVSTVTKNCLSLRRMSQTRDRRDTREPGRRTGTWKKEKQETGE